MFLIPKETIRLKCGNYKRLNLLPIIVDQALLQFRKDFNLNEMESQPSKHLILTLRWCNKLNMKNVLREQNRISIFYFLFFIFLLFVKCHVLTIT